MERSNSEEEGGGGGGLLSCWGHVKLKLLPLTKRGIKISKQRSSTYKPVGRFRYDPLSYAQNFDEGLMNEDEESLTLSFSARFAAPSSTKSLGDKVMIS
ncbi:Late embryogenesis abundant protein, LEA-14 [Quillaja saponaria]|uniref:Late embryogenesis abundant protein, LEA-14 n=1 Tax=Quillaja saponaria TaxID=32244 RepID=A0AAD7LKB9_QUISA|nr:Late embryogenesis abundant protein, LEA-14 [Quillaja saponaria]